ATQVELVGDEDQVVPVEVLGLKLARRVFEGEPAPGGLLDRARVDGVPQLLGARSRTFDLDPIAQARFLDEPAHHALGGGRAADVPPAHEAEACPVQRRSPTIAACLSSSGSTTSAGAD